MFEPDRDITRAEFAAIIVRALGMKPVSRADLFDDVFDTDWFCGYITTAYEAGLVSGYGNGAFGPMDKISREQAMTIIARTMGITGLENEIAIGELESLSLEYDDWEKSSLWAKTGIAKCVNAGLVSGKGGKMLAPKDNITRAEVAALVRRLLQKSDLI
jgi:hypothetical protein